MYELIKIVLDNCKDNQNFNFKILDPKSCKNINTHPLTLLAKSGQETLLKHETTLMLLNLKWRFMPRFLFYANLLFYLLFLILFSYYILDIHERFMEKLQTNESIQLNVSEEVSSISRVKRMVKHIGSSAKKGVDKLEKNNFNNIFN